MSRGGITREVVGKGIVALGGNEFETGIITIAAGITLKAGSLLKRAGSKFAPVLDTSPQTITADVNETATQIPIPGTTKDTPVAVNPFDIPNPGASAADLSLRAIISGPVRADLLLVGTQGTTDDQNDMLRNYGIIPIQENDISWTE
ncbi:hypothetical protein FACS189447_07990 [Spirochaetia bacterium]|nr:hypothetical protein FACS189447_07990 [Spirochaetia bacterium]